MFAAVRQKIHLSICSNLRGQLYGVYHGRLIQTLLIHFDGQIKTATATAMATPGDQV